MVREEAELQSIAAKKSATLAGCLRALLSSLPPSRRVAAADYTRTDDGRVGPLTPLTTVNRNPWSNNNQKRFKLHRVTVTTWMENIIVAFHPSNRLSFYLLFISPFSFILSFFLSFFWKVICYFPHTLKLGIPFPTNILQPGSPLSDW